MKLTGLICRRMNRKKTTGFFQGAQIASAGAMAFMHGAQDGQKFIGVFMLGLFLSKGESNVTSFVIPIWLMILCSAVMALGTSIGGYRIIKSVGMDMVSLEKIPGLCRGLSRRRLSADLFSQRPAGQHHPYQNHRHHGRRGL